MSENINITPFIQSMEHLTDTFGDPKTVAKLQKRLGIPTAKTAVMEDVICPECGSKTQLSKTILHGYCRVCGERIKLTAAERYDFSDEFIKTADDKTLVKMAALVVEKSGWNSKVEKMYQRAWEAKNTDAALALAQHYFTKKIYTKSMEYTKDFIDRSPDLMTIYAVSMVYNDDNPDDYPKVLSMLEKAAKNGSILCKTAGVEECIQELCQSIQKRRELEEQERRRKEEASAVSSSSYTPSYSSYTPSYQYSASNDVSKMQDSIWYDFRTGERLKEKDGKKYNSKGEEVSVAWWD